MPTIVFSHANSFCASTYRVLFKDLKRRGYTVHAIDKLGHDEKYPVSDNWPHLVRQLGDYAKQVADSSGEPVWLIGHSLGGYLSLMAATTYPELALGVVLIDSPIVAGWRSTALGVAKATQLMGSFSPGASSRKRRDNWPSIDATYEHFRHKKAFAKWDDVVLRDYASHGTQPREGKRFLSFDPAVETRLYNTVPDNMQRLIKKFPVKCPVTYIGGNQSAEMKQVGMDMTHKICKGRTLMLDGSHLFPMEKPLATAAAIETALRNMAG
jgi:pimeloyl-ACP methyl ester carboxylesterase